jgi:uncharacterized protein
MNSKKTLIKYRMEQAKESIDDARFLLDNNRSLSLIANRVYYAMFYAILALLQARGLRSSKHSGAIALFNKEFIKEKTFPVEMSHSVKMAFDMRHKGDYKELVVLDRALVIDMLKKSEDFVANVDKYLKENYEI